MTLLVSGKSKDEPKIRLEIELASGRTVLRPLPSEFLSSDSRLVDVWELTDWLHLDLPTAVDAVREIYPHESQYLDSKGLAEMLGVAVDAPLSYVPYYVRPEGERWILKFSRLPGAPRLPLGKVSLAGKEKAAYPTPPAATTVSFDGEGAEPASPAYAAGGSGGRPGSGLLWAVGIGALVVVGLVLFLVLRSNGSDEAATAADQRSSVAEPTPPTGPIVANTEGGADGTLALADYADAACEIFADRLVAANTRFEAAVTQASGATDGLPDVYRELSDAAAGLADALAATSRDLQDLPPPDVAGGAEAHQATVASYSDASDAVRGIATVTADFDPTTATQQDAAALADSINQGLTAFTEALAETSGDTEIDAAFAQSQVCTAL